MTGIDGNPHGASFLTIIAFGLVLVPLTFGLRLWARWLSAIQFWWDDVVAGIAMLGALGVAIVNTIGLTFGAGYHAKDLSQEDQENYARTLFAYFFLHTCTVTLIKFSLLLLYWRTFTLKTFRHTIYAVGGIICANALTNIFGFLFQCTPVEKFWNTTIPGHCIDQALFITMASVFYMITDFIIYIMPMPVIWHLQMNARRRAELSVVFLVGGFICLTGIIRIVYTIRIQVDDITFTNANPAIWNMVESLIGFVAANFPSMGPLFSKVGMSARRLRYGKQSETDRSSRTVNTQRGIGKGFTRMWDEPGTAAVETSAQREGTAYGESVPLGGIVVKTDLQQDREDIGRAEEQSHGEEEGIALSEIPTQIG